jgi:RNA polymerase sigma-70 factor (ECF subfamily)
MEDRLTDPRSDNELLAAARDDPAAFRELYDRWAERILGYFYRRTFDAHVSADLVAETFAVAWLRRDRFRDVGKPGASWLFGIARRELGRYRRRQGVELRAVQRLGMRIPELGDDDIARIEEIVDAAAYREALADALGGLGDDDREAIRLRVVEDLPFREVAAALGCSEGAARVRVHRALNRVADAMGVER